MGRNSGGVTSSGKSGSSGGSKGATEKGYTLAHLAQMALGA